jgi:hypothetical protein
MEIVKELPFSTSNVLLAKFARMGRKVCLAAFLSATFGV